MKKLITIGFFGLFILSQTIFAAEWKSVRIGTEGAYPPFNSVDPSGKLIGFDIDIAKALCDELNAKCTFVIQEWDGIIPALLANKFDAIIASMSITEKRKKKVAFTIKYYDTPTAFVAKKNYGDVSPKSLKGKSIGVQGATIFDEYLTAQYTDSNIKRYKTMDEIYLDIASGRIEVFIADALLIQDAFLDQDRGKGYSFAGPLLINKKWFGDGIGIAIRQENQDLVEKFNKAIVTIRSNGVYAKINQKYFDFDIYGD